MRKLEPIDMRSHVIDVDKNWSISARETRRGPPVRVDGMTFGVATMTRSAPHGGEVHPDGDEVLYVVSGRVRITCDSMQDDLVLDSGQACIVPRGEWHRVHVLEPTQFVHITPGPRGEHRPIA